jgi:hypothetical protein
VARRATPISRKASRSSSGGAAICGRSTSRHRGPAAARGVALGRPGESASRGCGAELAARIPATVECASVDDWLPRRWPSRGAARPRSSSTRSSTSISGARRRGAFHRALDDAGARASAEAPLAWLRF